MGGALDTKIVDKECELDRMCVIFLESGNDEAMAVSGFVEALFEEVVSKAPSLGKAMHAVAA